jgi:hypothetical protein
VLLPALWGVFFRRREAGILFISAALLVMPAVLVAVKPIAWTPFAERYLYLSTAFFVLGLVGISSRLLQKYTVVVVAIFVLLICGSAFSSVQRNLLWKNPRLFFQDAVAKSPEFGSLYYSLGGILMQNGDVDQAAQAFASADRLNQRVSMRHPIKSAIMGAMIAKGDNVGARKYFYQLFNNKLDAPTDFLTLLHQADDRRIAYLNENDKHLLAYDLLDTLELLYKRTSDPFWLYRSGQISLVTGNKAGAAKYFSRAYSDAPIDAYYRNAAHMYLKKLESYK